MKKGIFLLSTIFILIAGWSGVWFFVSGKVETTISETKTKLEQKGRTFDCANQEVNGYPFRISLNCDAVRYTDQTTGIRIEAGKLKSAAQAYQPNKAIVELNSPANITLPNSNAFNTSWSSLRSSLKVGLSGPQTLSIHGKEVVITPKDTSAQTILIKDMQVHSRQVGENNINLALNLDEATSQSILWPGFDLSATILLEDTYQDIIDRKSLLRVVKTTGLKGDIERLLYSPLKGGKLEISGPVSINPEGEISGKFEVIVSDLPDLIIALSESFPNEKRKFEDASKAINLLAIKTGNEIRLPITVFNGKASIGIIPLGKLDPLF